MLVLLLTLAVLSVHGQNADHQDETLQKVLLEVEKWKETVVQEVNKRILAQEENAERQYEALRRQFDIQTENMGKVQSQNAILKHEIQELNRSRFMEPLICFSAVKISIQETSQGDNILFEEEVIDTHDTYNPTYGVYVIPQDGVYEVIVTLHQQSGSSYDPVDCDLYVDNTFLARLQKFTDSNTVTNAYMTSSIIQEFGAGDALHVVSSGNYAFYGSSIYRASQFSAKYLGPGPSAK